MKRISDLQITPITNARMFFLFCVLHHCASFARECHGTAAVQAYTTPIYDVTVIDKYYFYYGYGHTSY
jgi:hypothetical protein